MVVCACDSGVELVALDLARWLTCRRCRPVAASAVDVETIAVLREILGGQLAEALARPASPATDAVERLGVAVLEQHTERRLRVPPLLGAVGGVPDSDAEARGRRPHR